MTSVTNPVLRSVAIAWFKVLYSSMKSQKEVDEESGYGSDGQEKSFIARAEYVVTCEIAKDFKEMPKDLPTTAITKSQEQYIEYLLKNTRGNGKGYFEFTYRVGTSNRPWCFLGGSWQSLIMIAGVCEALAHEWSTGKEDFEFEECMWKNLLYEEMLFTVKIRLFIQETRVFSVLLSMHPGLPSHLISRFRNPQFDPKYAPRSVTKKSSELAVQSLCKLGSKYSSDVNSLAVASFLSNLKALWVSESEGVAVVEENYPCADSFMRDFKKGILQTSSSDELDVQEERTEKESWGSCFPAEDPLTPPATPKSLKTSKDSRSPLSSPLSPEGKSLDYNYVKGGDPMHHVRQILPMDIPAVKDKASTNGSPPSRPIVELTPPESPVRDDSSSSPPPKQQLEPFHVRSLKDLYSNDQPVLASCSQFSSALKHFASNVFEPVSVQERPCAIKPKSTNQPTVQEECCPYANDYLKTWRRNSASELGPLDNFEPGRVQDTGRPEVKSKLFGTWTDLNPDTQTSSAFVDKFQYGFYANENCWVKMMEDSFDTFLYSV